MARPGPFALPEEKKWPIGDLKHANLAITFLYMEKVDDETRRKVARALRKKWGKNTKLMDRLKKMEEKKLGRRTGMAKRKKKKSTTKGRRRKGAPKGARLAYDALKRKKRKKKVTRKKATRKKCIRKKASKRKITKRKRRPKPKKGILAFLTSALG